MKDDFKIISLTKKFILNLDNVLSLFPNKERVLKDRLYDTSYGLLEGIYSINYLPKESFLDERIYFQHTLFYKISMLDFYLEQAYLNKYISEKKCIGLSKQLSIIHQMIIGWVKSEKSNS